MMIRRLLVLLLLLLPVPAAARVLTVATWNLDWLTLRPAGDSALPPDVKPRTPADFARLGAYAKILNADVIALEEVDGPAPAAKVFPPDLYTFHFTHDHVMQRVGFAIRRGISFTANPDLRALDPYPPDATEQLRSGADITLHLGATKLRLLAVHLKTGCWQVPLRARRYACAVLREQLPVIEKWIAARVRDATPFLVLGDFNRVLRPHGRFLTGLEHVTPLGVATSGYRNPCWGGRFSTFIDQILAGDAAKQWMDPASFQVLVYRETAPVWRDRLSDHCPLKVELNLPG